MRFGMTTTAGVVDARSAAEWARVELNHGPPVCKTGALANVSYGLVRANHGPGEKIGLFSGFVATGKNSRPTKAGGSLPENAACTDDDADHLHGAYTRQ